MGDILGGRFSIVEIISEGRLYKTVDTATGGFAAVKRWISEDSFYERELSALSSIAHSDVPRIICSFEDDNGKYIAEEWLDGLPPELFFSTDTVLDLAVSIAEFINCISSDSQSKRIHGDIKPSNIIVCDGKIRFIDFESSILVNNEECINIFRQKTASVMNGFFTAPEVFYGKPCIQSDIFSLGMIIIWICGGMSETGIDLSCLENNTPLMKIVEKCISYMPADRYKNAAVLLSELKKLQARKQNRDFFYSERGSKAIMPKKSLKFSLYIDCNVCFAWETASVAANCFGMKCCIIALTERTQKKLNYYAVSSQYYGEEIVAEEAAPYIFDSRFLYKKNYDEWLKKGLIHCSEISSRNLFYSGARLIDELEPESQTCISDLILWGKENFDCAIFITDRYDDKTTVKNLTAKCDYTIATPLANIDDVEACKNYYEQLGGNVLYAAWEYNEKVSLPEESIALIVEDENYLGAISHDDERIYKRNFIGKILPIFQNEEKNSDMQYIRIINRLFQTEENKNERKCV